MKVRLPLSPPLVVALIVLSIGCARFYWTKPGFNQADWNRDVYECERDMRQSGYFGEGIGGAINAQNFQERCLIARGYYKVRASAPSAPALATTTPASPSPAYDTTSDGAQSCSGANKKKQIAALQRKLDDGLITKDEFETRRVKIIMEPVFGGCGEQSR